MPNTDFEGLLQQIREDATEMSGQGSRFEKLVVGFLHNDPNDDFDEVWLWNEWSDRWGVDAGIDIAAREQRTGDYWAVQCKFRCPEHTIYRAEIDSFLAESGREFFARVGTHKFNWRLFVSTTNRWNRIAEKTIERQTPRVSLITLQDLERSPVDWSKFDFDHPPNARPREKREVREDQREAIEAVINGFEKTDRGKMIMACSTGKTFTFLRLAEKIVPAGGKVLFSTPSISLVAQSLRVWTDETHERLRVFVVNSDTGVECEEDIRLEDLPIPATTDAEITKEDLFWYIYGILPASKYRQGFDGSLKRVLPLIPFARDFRMFGEAERKLGESHLNYETVEPYHLSESGERLVMEDKDHRVHRVRFGRSIDGKDGSVIHYNDELILRGIPPDAYDYVVNGKSAIELIMERYAVTVDKDSAIRNDPNDWSEDPRHIVDLLKRIITVSVKTMQLVSDLPPLNESKPEIEYHRRPLSEQITMMRPSVRLNESNRHLTVIGAEYQTRGVE